MGNKKEEEHVDPGIWQSFLTSLPKFRNFIATQGLAVLLVLLIVCAFLFYYQPRFLDEIVREQKAANQLLQEIRSQLDPEKRPPLRNDQALLVLDLASDQWLTNLKEKMPNLVVDPGTRILAPHNLDGEPVEKKGVPRKTAEQIPPAVPGYNGPVLLTFFNETVVIDPKLTKGEKAKVILAVIRAGMERSSRELQQGKQQYSDAVKFAERNAQVVRQELRVFKIEGGTLEDVWKGAFERSFKELHEDLLKCFERDHAKRASREWDGLRVYLQRDGSFEVAEIRSLFPKAETGSSDICVAYADFLLHMHDACEKHLRQRPLVGGR